LSNELDLFFNCDRAAIAAISFITSSVLLYLTILCVICHTLAYHWDPTRLVYNNIMMIIIDVGTRHDVHTSLTGTLPRYIIYCTDGTGVYIIIIVFYSYPGTERSLVFHSIIFYNIVHTRTRIYDKM